MVGRFFVNNEDILCDKVTDNNSKFTIIKNIDKQ